MVLAIAVYDSDNVYIFLNVESACASLNHVQIKDMEIKTGLACWPT